MERGCSTSSPTSPMEVEEEEIVPNKKPSQYDYATLYEEWHLQQKQQRGAVAAGANDSSTTSGVEYARALAFRAGQMGTLQCAVLNSKNPGFLQALMERMELEDRGVAATLPMPEYVFQNPQQQQPPHHHHQQKQQPRHVAVNIDDFFDEYPECVRQNWEAIGDDSSSSSDESTSTEQEEEQRLQSRKKRPLSVETTMPAKFPENSMVEEETSAAAASSNSCSKHVPFASMQNQRQHATMMAHNNKPLFDYKSHQPVPTHHPYQGHNNHNNGTYQTTQNISNQGWDDDYQSSLNRRLDHNTKDPMADQNNNPFQTAREFANLLGGEHQQQQNFNNSNNNNNSVYNPYQKPQQQEEEQEEEPVAVAQSNNIRESLKRKFQPPKRGAGASLRQSARESNNDKSKSNGTQKKKHSQGGVTTTTNNSNNGSNKGANDDDHDEDDLPEALKKFGKDLVEKIKSEIMDNGEPVTFDDIAGLEDAKKTIHEIVCWPMKRPDLFTGLRKTPNGLLLFGPPGTGKTLIGKAIAHASGATFFSISSSALTSKWMGEGEKLVRTLFGVAAFHEPSCIFLDEVDSLLTQRKSDDSEASRRIKTEFLVQLDGSSTSEQGRVLVIGATNRPQELDEAARRRFVKRLYIPLPTESDRACLLKVLLSKNDNKLTERELEKLARDTAGFSGADLKALSADAAMGPIRQLGSRAMDVDLEDLPPITYKHFRQSLRGMHPSVSSEDITQYEVFDNTYGSKRASETQEDDGDDSDSDNSHRISS